MTKQKGPPFYWWNEGIASLTDECFRASRWLIGTIEYCGLVTLDIRNAFNAADCERIRRALAAMNTRHYLSNLVNDYFENRRLMYYTDEGTESYEVFQGSVLGPSLWNLMYDGVFRPKSRESLTLQLSE